MNYLDCPDDAAHLKADPQPSRAPGRPLRLVCPECGKAFELRSRGLVQVPASEEQ